MAVNEPLGCEPLKPLLPDHAPEALQEVALMLDQAIVEPLPEFTVLGVALRVTAGGRDGTVTVTDCVAEPPSPLQVRS